MSRNSRKERIIPIRIEGDDEEIVKPEIQAKEVKNVSRAELSPEKDEDQVKMDIKPDTDSDATSDGCLDELVENMDELLKKDSVHPPFNVPEKIILAIDSCQDFNSSYFLLNQENKKIPALAMFKLALSNMIRTKLNLDAFKRHEIAVVVLNENRVDWVLDFTNNPDKVMKAINNIGVKESEDVFDLTCLFELISEKIKLQKVVKVDGIIIPPPNLQRLILFYNRSYTLPELEISNKINDLLKSDYFFFDVLMAHEPIDSDNHAEKISNILQNIPCKNEGYFLSVERNTKKLLDSLFELVRHPLQRPRQELADCTLKLKSDCN